MATPDAALAAPADAAATTVKIPAVTSTDQRNGVTAGYVNQLNVVPLVPTPQLEALKALWTGGAQLFRVFGSIAPTDAQIDEFASETDAWYRKTFQYLKDHVSEYAAERFAFRSVSPTLSYTLRGDHAAGYIQKYSNYYNALASLLVNLDQVMRDPAAYPGGVPPR